jgi:arylsulfatase A-like enzyme
VQWPVEIEGGRVEHSVASLLDLMPTFSALADVPLPEDRPIDGMDISFLLRGDHGDVSRQMYYQAYMSTDMAALRDGDWKLKLPRSGYPKFLEPVLKLNSYSHDLLLFNLKDDPSERHNLVVEYPERVATMKRSLTAFENEIAEERGRKLYLQGTKADRKGYGTFFIKVAFLSGVLVVFVFFVIRLIYKAYREVIRSKGI